MRTSATGRNLIFSAVAISCALVALTLAAAPWLGDRFALIDTVAPVWPAAAILAVAALALTPTRSIVATAALAAIALCVPTIVATPQPETPLPVGAVPAGLRLVIVTHNVWIANVDPLQTAAALARSGADIVLLQETEGRFRTMMPALRRIFSFGDDCHYRCSLAILSRYPLDRVVYRFRDEAGRQVGPRLLQTRVHLPGGIVAPIVTLHLPRGAPADADLKRRRSLAEAVRRADTRSMILAGDLNLVPWSARMRRLDGWLAPMRRATAAFSYPARLFGRRFPLPLVPIDHVYTGPHWSLASVRRLPRTGSDHYPVRVDLIWHGPDAMLTEGS